MELIKWACDVCGGTLSVPEGKFVECENCGTRYFMDGHEEEPEPMLSNYTGEYNVVIGYQAGGYNHKTESISSYDGLSMSESASLSASMSVSASPSASPSPSASFRKWWGKIKGSDYG